MIDKLACGAALCYNLRRNIVVLGGTCNTPSRIHLDWRCIMDILSSNDPQGKPHYVYSLAYPESMGGCVFYIGKGTGKRINNHEQEARNKKGRSNHKLNTIRKIWACGEEVVKRKLAFFTTHEEACLYEIALIFFMDGLTNATNGGDGIYGYVHTEEELQKIKEARQRQVITEAHKQSLSKSHKTSLQAKAARKHLVLNQTGKTRSPVTIKKMSDAGKARTDLYKMHNANRGRVQPEAERQMRSEALLGCKRSEATIKRMSNAAKLRGTQPRKRGLDGRFISD